MSRRYTLIYNDIRKRRFFFDHMTSLENKVLGRKGEEIQVTEEVKNYLLNTQFNGDTPCFIEKKNPEKQDLNLKKEDEEHGVR